MYVLYMCVSVYVCLVHVCECVCMSCICVSVYVCLVYNQRPGDQVAEKRAAEGEHASTLTNNTHSGIHNTLRQVTGEKS